MSSTECREVLCDFRKGRQFLWNFFFFLSVGNSETYLEKMFFFCHKSREELIRGNFFEKKNLEKWHWTVKKLIAKCDKEG